MKLKLWNAPFNGGWVWFERKNLWRCEAGWDRPHLWWAVLGFSGYVTLQTWPLQRSDGEVGVWRDSVVPALYTIGVIALLAGLWWSVA